MSSSPRLTMVPVQLLLALLLPLTAVAQFAGLRAHTQEGREARSNHKIYQETRRQLEEQYDFMKRWQNDTYRYKSDKTEREYCRELTWGWTTSK